MENWRAVRIFQEFNDSILNVKKTLEQYQLQTIHVIKELAHLNMEKTKLENVMEYFQNNNEVYLKIKRVVKLEIEHIMANPSHLQRFAVVSIFESA